MDHEEVTEQEYNYSNMPGIARHVHPLPGLCFQSAGLLGFGFRNLKAARTSSSLVHCCPEKFPALADADPPLDELPHITPHTVSYALSPVTSCVCYSANGPMSP